MNLSNKTILLTGASGGIGANTAKLLAEQGATLLLTGRNEIALKKLLDELTNSSQHHILAADLTLPKDRQALSNKAKTLCIDILINVAGVNELALLDEMDETQIQQIINCNLTTTILLCRDLLPTLKSRPKAMIVNVGSILGSIGLAGSTLYCASKFGLRGFSEALRRELADSDVQVLYFAPRATDTQMNDSVSNELNRQLGNQSDSPQWVAQQLVSTMQQSKPYSRYLGWPEKLFVRINAIFPKLVDNSVKAQLATIKKLIQKTNPKKTNHEDKI